MKVITFQDAEAFLNKAQTWLEEREVENSLMLGLAFRLQKYPERIKTQPFLGCVEGDGIIRMATVMTPPHNLVLAGQPDEESLQALASGLTKQSASVPGVVGPKGTSLAFAHIWKTVTGKSFQPVLRTRLYQLDHVIHPTPIPGLMRAAQKEDIPLLTGWISAFQEEALHEKANQEEVLRQAEIMVADKQAFIWEDREPVCMAASARPTHNGVTVNAVYTPPKDRRKGYASACVAALSQRLLDQGYKFCCLFTDLANPTSNHIYMDVGYRPVCDFEEQRFNLPAGEADPGNPG